MPPTQALESLLFYYLLFNVSKKGSDASYMVGLQAQKY